MLPELHRHCVMRTTGRLVRGDARGARFVGVITSGTRDACASNIVLVDGDKNGAVVLATMCGGEFVDRQRSWRQPFGPLSTVPSNLAATTRYHSCASPAIIQGVVSSQRITRTAHRDRLLARPALSLHTYTHLQCSCSHTTHSLCSLATASINFGPENCPANFSIVKSVIPNPSADFFVECSPAWVRK